MPDLAKAELVAQRDGILPDPLGVQAVQTVAHGRFRVEVYWPPRNDVPLWNVRSEDGRWGRREDIEALRDALTAVLKAGRDRPRMTTPNLARRTNG